MRSSYAFRRRSCSLHRASRRAARPSLRSFSRSPWVTRSFSSARYLSRQALASARAAFVDSSASVDTAAAWRARALSLVGVFGVRAAGFFFVDDSAASVSSKRRGVFFAAGFLGAGVVDASAFWRRTPRSTRSWRASWTSSPQSFMRGSRVESSFGSS